MPYGTVGVVLSGNGSHILSAVLHTVEVVAEPAVEHIVVGLAVDVKLQVAGRIAGGQMSILVEQRFTLTPAVS